MRGVVGHCCACRSARSVRGRRWSASRTAPAWGAAGVSFTPVPGLLGSDLLARRPDFRVIDDPFRPGQQVVLVPAIVPEYALLHGRRADPDGNVVIGIEYDDRLVARAAGHVVYSVAGGREDATRVLDAGEQV